MTSTTRRRHEEMFTRRRTARKKTIAKVRVMFAVLPSAPPSSLVMAALVALAGAAPTAAWSQGTAPATAPAVGAPVPLLPPAPRVAPAGPADRDAMVMTDTPEYCASLGGRVEDMARGVKVPTETEDLLREGQRLCEGGKTRVGVQHLRRAYIQLRQASTDR
jgi:hypothetical protein